jgi:xylose dehydrogenase (NAD/NADP)
MTRLRWGILSTAGVNRRLLAAASRSRRGEVVAVASRDASRGNEYAARHGIQRACGSYQSLLDDPEVDVVYISVPNSLHIEWTERAVAAGKHVLCEKPLASDVGRLARVLEDAGRCSLHVTESLPFRHMPHIVALRELLSAGAIGRVRYAVTALTYRASRDENPRFQPELDGGALLDIGCYCCSALRLSCGDPQRAAAVATQADSGVDLALSGVLAAEWLAQFTVSMDAATFQDLTVVGDDGVVHVPEPYRSSAATIEVQTSHERRVLEYACPDPFELAFENMTDAVLGSAPLVLGPDELVAQARVIEALRLSVMEGRTIELTESNGGRC